MREKVGNLEEIYFKLDEVMDVLNLVISGYFENIAKPTDDNERIRLAWDYKMYQSTLNIVYRTLRNEIESLKTNVYGLYDDLRGQQDEKI